MVRNGRFVFCVARGASASQRRHRRRSVAASKRVARAHAKAFFSGSARDGRGAGFRVLVAITSCADRHTSSLRSSRRKGSGRAGRGREREEKGGDDAQPVHAVEKQAPPPRPHPDCLPMHGGHRSLRQGIEIAHMSQPGCVVSRIPPQRRVLLLSLCGGKGPCVDTMQKCTPSLFPLEKRQPAPETRPYVLIGSVFIDTRARVGLRRPRGDTAGPNSPQLSRVFLQICMAVKRTFVFLVCSLSCGWA